MKHDLDVITDRLFLLRERNLGMGPWDDGGSEYLSYFRSSLSYSVLRLDIATTQAAHAFRPPLRRFKRLLARSLTRCTKA